MVLNAAKRGHNGLPIRASEKWNEKHTKFRLAVFIKILAINISLSIWALHVGSVSSVCYSALRGKITKSNIRFLGICLNVGKFKHGIPHESKGCIKWCSSAPHNKALQSRQCTRCQFA